MWGPRIALERRLIEGLWHLKAALFQCGDRVVEMIVQEHGVNFYRSLLDTRMSTESFITFEGVELPLSGSTDVRGWADGSRECEAWLRSHLTPEQARQILSSWIKATNKALMSVLHCEAWERACDERSAPRLIEIARDEEKDKNIEVVCSLLEASDAFEDLCPYQGQERRIVTATSRWFTLIDDWLDLERDWEGRQPNHIVARLIENNELESLGAKSLRNDFSSRAPLTASWYREAFATARTEFVSVFPVAPRLFRWMIERRALKAGVSPF